MIPAFDKYAPYIWSSFGFGVGALALLALWAWISARRADKLARRLEDETRDVFG